MKAEGQAEKWDVTQGPPERQREKLSLWTLPAHQPRVGRPTRLLLRGVVFYFSKASADQSPRASHSGWGRWVGLKNINGRNLFWLIQKGLTIFLSIN